MLDLARHHHGSCACGASHVAKAAAPDDWEWGLAYSRGTQDKIMRAWRRYTQRMRDLVDKLGPYRLAQNPPPPEVGEIERDLYDEWRKAVSGVVLESGQREAGKLKFPEKFILDNPYTQEWLASHGSEMIREVSRQTKLTIREEVYRAVTDHEPPRELAQSIKRHVGLLRAQKRALDNYEEKLIDRGVEGEDLDEELARYAKRLHAQRALNIARTETMRAQNAGNQQSWLVARENGWVSQASVRRWVSGAGSARTCEICSAFHHATATLDGVFTSENGDECEAPPAHPSCFPAGSVMCGPRALRATRRRYVGEMVELETGHGDRITVTPNHPMLTPEGWVTAGSLNEGDHLVRCADVERMLAAIRPNDKQVPARIEQVFASLSESRGMASACVPAASEHFHGDGIGGDVDVVGTDRLLLHDVNTPRAQHASQRVLGVASPASALDALRSMAECFERHGLSSDCVMCRDSVAQVLLGAAPAHHQPVGLGLAAPVNAGAGESARDNLSAASVRPCDGGLGHPGAVVGGDSLGVKENPWGQALRLATSADAQALRASAEMDAARDEQRVEGVLGHVQPLGQNVPGDAAQVVRDVGVCESPALFVASPVVRVHRSPFDGDVFNAETSQGWYAIGNVVVHNCRCRTVLITPTD